MLATIFHKNFLFRNFQNQVSIWEKEGSDEVKLIKRYEEERGVREDECTNSPSKLNAMMFHDCTLRSGLLYDFWATFTTLYQIRG